MKTVSADVPVDRQVAIHPLRRSPRPVAAEANVSNLGGGPGSSAAERTPRGSGEAGWLPGLTKIGRLHCAGSRHPQRPDIRLKDMESVIESGVDPAPKYWRGLQLAVAIGTGAVGIAMLAAASAVFAAAPPTAHIAQTASSIVAIAGSLLTAIPAATLPSLLGFQSAETAARARLLQAEQNLADVAQSGSQAVSKLCPAETAPLARPAGTADAPEAVAGHALSAGCVSPDRDETGDAQLHRGPSRDRHWFRRACGRRSPGHKGTFGGRNRHRRRARDCVGSARRIHQPHLCPLARVRYIPPSGVLRATPGVLEVPRGRTPAREQCGSG